MAASIQFHRSPQGLVGCTVGLAPGLFVGAFGVDLLDALHSAAHVASKMVDTVQASPELMALMPPGVGLAMKAISVASAAAKQGHSLRQVAAAHGPKVAALVANIVRAHGAELDA